MSASNREVAHRVFAAEYDEATFSYSESDEERAPNYLVTPTGARVNRVFLVGVLTEIEQVSDEVLRARVADPTGVFVVYAGQYQPDEMAFFEDAEPPMFVAVTGKARTFSPDGSDRVFTSVRPESVNEVGAETRDRWTVQAAERTLARVATARAAMDLDLAGDDLAAALRDAGVPEAQAAGVPLALDHYGTTEHYLAAVADLARAALAQVAGEHDEVPDLTVAPDDAGEGTVAAAAVAEGVEDAVVELDAGVEPSGGDGGSAGAPAASPEPSADETTAGADAESEEREPIPGESASASGGAGPPDADDEEAGAEATGDQEGAETTAESADAGAGADEDLGDFEPGGVAVDEADPAASDGEASRDEPETGDGAVPDDEPETDDGEMEDVLDDEERERLEEEYGTFESGTEVDEPGEADIEPEAGPIEPEDVDADGEPPAGDAEPTDAEADGDESEEGAEVPADDSEEPAPADADADEAAPEADGEANEEGAVEEGADEEQVGDVDVEAAVMDAMEDLDDGDGAEHEALVAAVVDDHGVDPGAVEDAIQDALMAGKCYEPDDDHVKPI